MSDISCLSWHSIYMLIFFFSAWIFNMIQIHPGETSQPQDFIACSVALQPHALKLALLTFLWEVDLEQVWGHSEDVILRENQWQQCKMLAVFSGYSFIDGRTNLVMHACISLSSFRLNSLNLNVHSYAYKRYDHFVHWDNEHCRQTICSCSSFHLNDHTLFLGFCSSKFITSF